MVLRQAIFGEDITAAIAEKWKLGCVKMLNECGGNPYVAVFSSLTYCGSKWL